METQPVLRLNFPPMIPLCLCLFGITTPQYPDTSAFPLQEYMLLKIEAVMEDAPEHHVETSDELQYYIDHPLNLNAAESDQLRRLHILDEWQIEALLHYRNSYGNIVRLEELSENVRGFSAHTLALLRPFVCLGEKESGKMPGLKQIAQTGKHLAMIRYGRVPIPTKAYTEHKYAGSPDRYLLQYTFNFQNKIRWGFAAKKDAGEAFNRHGFDSYAGYIAFRKGAIKNFVAGTYRIDWGFGLNVHTAGSFYGELSPDMLTGNGQGIRPYASGAEYGYLQGIATEIKLPRSWQTGLFYSTCKHDANLLSLPQDADEDTDIFHYIRSYPETGHHRTLSEITGKQAVRQQIYGLNLEKAFSSARIGIILSGYTIGGLYTPELRRTTFAPPVFSMVKPSHGADFSFYYRWLVRQFHVYGEAALSHTAAPSFLQGLQWKPSELFAISARYGYYAAGYYAAYAAVLNRRPPDRLHPGTEKHEFSWQGKLLLPAGFSLEASGKESLERQNKGFFLITSRYSLNLLFFKRPFNGYLRFQGGHAKSRKGYSLRFNLAYRLPAGFSGESRLEMRNFTKGILLLQDLAYTTTSGGFQCRLRMALFHTLGYENRIYAYEHDVRYTASSPALYGKGVRFCVLLKGALPKGFTLEFKYAHTLLDGVQTNGSGDNLMQGFLKPEIKAQLRYKF